MTPDRSFPKELRILRSSDFRRVQRRGRRVRTRHLLVVYLRSRRKAPRFGLTVSRKVGNAVTRNRVKRWLREAVRHHKAELDGVFDVVIIPNPKAPYAGYATLEAEVIDALGRLR